MKYLAMLLLLTLSGQALSEIVTQGEQNHKCHTYGGFFDFAPDGAIASCKQEIDEFCKAKGAPSMIGKVTGFPSGPARYARAEITFQCMTAADVAQKQKEVAEANTQQLRVEIESSKKVCQQDFGFNPGTTEFGNCLLELQKQHFANRRFAQDLAAQNEIAEAQLAQKRQAEADQATMGAIQSINRMTAPSTVRTNCTTYGSNVSCTSR